MNRLMQTASRGALIALIAAAPVAGFAQSEATDEQKPMTEQSTDSASVDTEMNADAEANTDTAATDTEMDADAEAGADTDMAATDTEMDADAEADANSDMAADDGAMTDEQTDMTADADAAGDTTTLSDTEMSADAETEAAPMDEANTEMAEAESAEPVEGQITMQDADTVLAEDLLGATVYNNNDENVGDINDLIIGLDGSVKGVVIGVGGFLGLGEKQVAVQMAALDVVERENGSPRLMTSATKTDLEAAPEFVSAADQASAQQMDDMQNSTDTMSGTQQPTE